jgi:hypothetical protein
MSQPPVSGVYRAVWPIVDDTFTREELIAEAQHALAALAAEDAVILTGPATWDTTRTGAEVPGWETWDGYVPTPPPRRRTPSPTSTGPPSRLPSPANAPSSSPPARSASPSSSPSGSGA